MSVELLHALNGAPDSPIRHRAIQGENLDVLRWLDARQERFGLIYIDPPYNTGSKLWRYNDAVQRSHWLTMMKDRLAVACNLLTDAGVIIVAIGDEEHHRLRTLMDDLFGAKNFISNVIWHSDGTRMSTQIPKSVDYMLIYAKNTAKTPPFKMLKKHGQEMLDLVAEAIQDSDTPTQAEVKLRAFLARHAGDASGVSGFNRVDSQGRVFQSVSLTNSLPRPNLMFDITDPATGKVFAPPKNGWVTNREGIQRLMDSDALLFTGKHPRKKGFLVDHLYETPRQVFSSPRIRGSRRLEVLLGERRFDYPKDPDVLADWFSAVAGPNARVLDFFAGSGSTGEAVLRLNARDGGTRQFTLVTNNEVGPDVVKRLTTQGIAPGTPDWKAEGVFEHVLRPRLEAVVTGFTLAGVSHGLEPTPANVDFCAYTPTP